MTFSAGDIVRIVNLPNSEDPFQGMLATIIKVLEPGDTLFDPGTRMYEIEVIDKDALEQTFDTLEAWDDLGLGLVYENEMELAE